MAHGNEDLQYMDVRGRDLVTGLPKVVPVSSKDTYFALEESVDMVVEAIKATLEKTAPEIAADIAVTGLMLSGGGGMLKNLDKIIAEKTNIRVDVAENAFEAVALGTGKSLANIDKLKRYANSKASIKYR